MRILRGESGQRFKSFSMKKVAIFKVIYLAVIAYLVYFLILVLAKGI